VSETLRRIDATALLRLLRFGLDRGATLIQFRVGAPPLYSVDADPKNLRHRPLTREDTEAILRLLFEAAQVPAQLGEMPGEAAQELYFYYELPGEGLFEIEAMREAAGLALTVEIVRPLTDPLEIALLES
jgi:hypothetical protein